MKIPAFILILCVAAFGSAQGYDPANYSNLNWSCVGPFRGGRSVACAGVRTRPAEFYFGATGGGLWKSTDSGASWANVTDGFVHSASVGAVAVSDSNPDVVYIGMGEREIRGNVAEGDGVYKSTDAGKTWTHLGLEATRVVSRIVIDPKDPNTVYVAAFGHVFDSNPERGVFKSTDGGRTWSKILFESDHAGAVELIMDPTDPTILFAATWEASRSPYMMISGGPGSKLWKTTDSGAHWTDMTRNPGLPTGIIGKIGMTISAANHRRMYAIVEAADGGIFRSDDAGATWTKVNSDSEYKQRGWYFNHVYADPKDQDKVYVLNVGAGRSVDGGKTWSGFRITHSDNHDMWINPDNSNLMIESNDGGASVSKDAGGAWSREFFPTAQFYHVIADNHIPYRIYGAQQDNSSVKLDPTVADAVDKRNFEGSAAGESGFIAVRWDDPDVAYGGNYGGNINLINSRLQIRHSIDPWPDNPMGHGAKDLKHRFQWTFPIVTSPHDPNVLYTASQFLLKSDNGGQSWKQISPDLTRNDKSKQESSGGPITKDNTSIEYYDTIFTVAESPLRKGLIWVGSDDGLVHVTQNGGGSWQDVTPQGMPHWGRVSIIDPSPNDPATAYVAVNMYQFEDMKPYIYRTHDFGKTWTKIVTGIAPDAFARVCREDLHRKGLLYAGTETGVYVSFDDGDHWQSLQQNLPLCPVHDLFLKDDDLIAATHGRSFWIMHGVSRLAELTPTKPAGPVLYAPIERMRLGAARAVVDYYLPAKANKVSFTFLDKDGQTVGTATGDVEPGFHSVSASLSHPGFGSFPGMVLWSGFPRAIACPPGTFTVKMDADGTSSSQQFHLAKDPRIPDTEKDLQEQYDLSVKIVEQLNLANGAVVRIVDTLNQIGTGGVPVGTKDADAINAKSEAVRQKLLGIEGEIYQYRSHSGEDPLNFPIMLNDRLAGLLSVVQSGSFKPSQQAHEVFAELSRLLAVQLDALKAFEASDLKVYNELRTGAGLLPIVPKAVPLQEAGNRRRGGGDEDGEGS